MIKLKIAENLNRNIKQKYNNIFFYENNHIYTNNKKEIIPSISSLNNIQYFFYDNIFNKNVEEIKEIQELVNFGSIRGNQIHDALNLIIKNWSLKNQINYSDINNCKILFKWTIWYRQFCEIINFLLKQDWTIIASEAFIFNKRYAGRVDLVVLDNLTKRVKVIDFKSNFIFSNTLNKLQLFGYAYGISENWLIDSIDLSKNNIDIAILHVTKNQKREIEVTFSELTINWDDDTKYFLQNIYYYNKGLEYKEKMQKLFDEKNDEYEFQWN